jgi:hypothetical protein
MPTEPQVGPPKPESHRQSTFMLDHKFEVRKDSQACAECHQPRFCESCHQKRLPDSHLHHWMSQHAGASEAGGAFCQVCHSRQMCDNCHREALHGPGWLDVHVQSGTKHAKLCAECHTRSFCAQCHEGARPASHRKPNFRAVHGELAKTSDCAQCHGQNSCATCHSKANPHPDGFEHTHGVVSQAAGANCAVCHKDQRAFCDACHKRPMPHPAEFVRQHGASAKQGGTPSSACMLVSLALVRTRRLRGNPIDRGADCTYCHGKRDCDGCHHSTRPATHTADFRTKHGKLAKSKSQDCMLCHRPSACNACHQLPMPHPPQYQAKHTADAKRIESACANCHKRSYCLQCHEEDEIHLPTAHLPDELPAAKPVAQWSGTARERALLNQLAEWQAQQAARGCPAMHRAP